MPREDFASPVFLVSSSFLLLERQEEKSRFRVDPFHFNNLHPAQRPLGGAEFRIQGSDRLSRRWKCQTLGFDCGSTHPAPPYVHTALSTQQYSISRLWKSQNVMYRAHVHTPRVFSFSFVPHFVKYLHFGNSRMVKVHKNLICCQ